MLTYNRFCLLALFVSIKGGSKVSIPLSKSMISITNLYEVIDQIMSFCRKRLELSSGKDIVRNTEIDSNLMVILLILRENFYVTSFETIKKKFFKS